MVGKLSHSMIILHTKRTHAILKLILFELSSLDAQKIIQSMVNIQSVWFFIQLNIFICYLRVNILWIKIKKTTYCEQFHWYGDELFC